MDFLNRERKYWTKKNLSDLENARTYSDLGKVAFDVLGSMPQPIGQVCGPISTGGVCSIEENLKIFDRTIMKLTEEGNAIFDQMPFQYQMGKLRAKSALPQNETNTLLLENFYLPIFQSGIVRKFFFIHGWKSSYGARWEHERAGEFGASISYLPRHFLD